MTFSLPAGRFQVAPSAQSAAAVVKARQWLQSFDATLPTARTWVLSVLESSAHQGQVTATPEPQGPVNGGCDGLPCPTCSTSRVNKTTGQAEVTTVAGSGGGAALALSIDLQLNQPATTAPLPHSTAPFGNGWSRTAAPSLTMRGTDPANPTSVSIRFNPSDTRVYQNIPTPSGQAAFSRATRQGSTDRLAPESPNDVFRTAAGDTLTFNGFDAGIWNWSVVIGDPLSTARCSNHSRPSRWRAGRWRARSGKRMIMRGLHNSLTER